MPYTVYCHTCRVTGLRYVGQTKLTIDARWQQHCRNAQEGGGSIFAVALRAHGPDAWSHEILETCDTRELSNAAEQKWIAYYRSNERDFGYNTQVGGGMVSRDAPCGVLPSGVLTQVQRAIAIARPAAKRTANELAGLTLEKLVTAPNLGALKASPAQRALLAAADGRVPDLPPDRLRFHFGLDAWPIEVAGASVAHRPRTVILRTGVRAGKSLISALALLLSVLTCRFRRPPEPHEQPDADGMVGVRPGELVRALIVAPLLKLSRAPFDHLIGTMRASPVLAPLLVKAGAESCVIRRPDGFEVTVELVAASSGGANLRSTWLAGAIFDEADFHDDEEGAVNLPDNYRAAITRMLHGAQIWIPSSPWSDSGPFNEMFVDAFGSPGHMLAFHSDTRSMNPSLPREDEEAERRRDPDNAAREYDAIPLSANSPAWFPESVMSIAFNAARPMLLPANDTACTAGGDLGFRKNSSALAIARPADGKVQLAYYEEMRPEKGHPLKPSAVCKSFSETMTRYGAGSIRGDYWYSDTAREEFAKVDGRDGEQLRYDEWAPTLEAQTAAFTEFRRLLAEGKADLPDDPRIRLQMKGTTTRNVNGKVYVRLPKQGRAHGDLLMSIVLAFMQVRLDEPPDDGNWNDQITSGNRMGDARGW